MKSGFGIFYLQFWPNHLILICFSFLISKVGTITITASVDLGELHELTNSYGIYVYNTLYTHAQLHAVCISLKNTNRALFKILLITFTTLHVETAHSTFLPVL